MRVLSALLTWQSMQRKCRTKMSMAVWLLHSALIGTGLLLTSITLTGVPSACSSARACSMAEVGGEAGVKRRRRCQ